LALVLHLHSLSLIHLPSTSFGWGKGWNVTSDGWQVTLCDAIWHVNSSSGVVTSVSKLLYSRYFTHPLGFLQILQNKTPQLFQSPSQNFHDFSCSNFSTLGTSKWQKLHQMHAAVSQLYKSTNVSTNLLNIPAVIQSINSVLVHQFKFGFSCYSKSPH